MDTGKRTVLRGNSTGKTTVHDAPWLGMGANQTQVGRPLVVTEKSTVSHTMLWAWRLRRDSESPGERTTLEEGVGEGKKGEVAAG